jgi:uncharacterized surface protein with fasciclin (FAS1) repeats
MLNRLRLFTGLFILVFAVAACGDTPEPAEPMDDDMDMVEETPTTTGTIVDVAASNDSFDTLVAAVQAAGLVETLSGEGPFTVFAPTDEAFEALPEGTVENLLLPENRDQLRTILTYHVVPGRVMAADVVGLTSAATVQGEEIGVMVNDGTVMLNDAATVTATDIEASNGIIHVIDSVIMPPSMQ